MGLFDSIKRKLGYDIKNSNGVNEEYWSVYKIGKVLHKKYYKKDGRLHGKYTEYITKKDNWITLEVNYKNGKKDGYSRYYWNNKLSTEAIYQNGTVIGVAKKFSENGQIQALADIDKGIYKVFNLSTGNKGNLLEKSEIKSVKISDGTTSTAEGKKGGIYPVKQGLFEKWDGNGKLIEKSFWQENPNSWGEIYDLSMRADGEYVIHHENGKVSEKGNMKNGKKVGVHQIFSDEGSIKIEIHYKNGNLIKEIWYNEDGSLMNANQIIKEGGTSPVGKKIAGISHISWGDDHWKTESVIVNDIKFNRTLAGHTYKIIETLDSKKDKNVSIKKESANSEKIINAWKQDVSDKDISGLNQDQKMIALVFFPKLRGINFGDVSLKIKGNSPQEFMTSDINGKWFFMSSNMTILFKAFSEEKFDQSLQELLKKNNIKLEDEIQEKEIRVWNGDGFKIENPPMINNVHIIIITNENFVHVDAMSLKETDLTSEISLPQEYRYIGIKHVYDGNKTLKKSKDIIKELTNVALLFKDDDSDFILIANASLPPSKQIIDSIVEKNGGKNNFKFNDKIDDTWEHVYQGKQFVIGYLKQHSTIRINFLKFSNEIEEFENNLRSLSPPIGTADFWIDILNKRGESRKMFKKSFNQTFHDSAQGHCQEYILKYENDQMTIEDIYNRIDVYHLFIEQYDILFSKYQELNKSIPEEIENKFFALLESLAGAELTLLKIQKNYDHDIDEERIFKDVKRSNNGIVEDDEKESNKDLVDKDIFTYYKGYLFNGILVVHYEDEKREMSMRFGLKHGSYTRYDKKGKIIESKQAWNDAV